MSMPPKLVKQTRAQTFRRHSSTAVCACESFFHHINHVVKIVKSLQLVIAIFFMW